MEATARHRAVFDAFRQAKESSSAACNVGAMVSAEAHHARLCDTTTSAPSRPDFNDASFMALSSPAP
jgi:hypothetical protein